MTKKEFEIQRALGTLPLWMRIERNEVEFTEVRLRLASRKGVVIKYLMRISCEGVTATYHPGSIVSRREAIKRLTLYAKKYRHRL